MSSSKQQNLVRWDLFGSPRNPKNMNGSRLIENYTQNCKDILAGYENQLDKGIIYYGGGWNPVSRMSPQTSSELSIINDPEFQICVEATGEILIIELGPGDLTKTGKLLDKVSRLDKITLIYYVAVDFNKPILNGVQHLKAISSKVQLYCLWGSFDDALKFIQKWEYGNVKIYVWSLGSTLSNDLDSVVSERFRKWSAIGELLIGQDGKQGREEMEAVYKSPEITELLDCGMRAANELAEGDLFCETDEKVYEFTESKVRVSIIRQDKERIVIFVAFKHDEDKMRDIAQQAGCNVSSIWQSGSSRGSCGFFEYTSTDQTRNLPNLCHNCLRVIPLESWEQCQQNVGNGTWELCETCLK